VKRATNRNPAGFEEVLASPEHATRAIDVTGNGKNATDVDCDCRYEKVNGQGEANVVDVQALFASCENKAAQNNTDAFDFSDAPTGDGEVNVVDVQALFVDNTQLGAFSAR
jgi:hypothetical protein